MRLQQFDRQHLWHPYAPVGEHAPANLAVRAARATRLYLEDGSTLIDGMSSWWSVIHGYNHPVLNTAVRKQLSSVSHVMFGGLTHQPAALLGETLLKLVPPSLSKIFYCDSGSVAVEVAVKMAFQYWRGQGQTRSKLLALRGAYHGDTFTAMSICDPINGMHRHFAPMLGQHLFAPRPQSRFGEQGATADQKALHDILDANHKDIAAVIVEPILQGAGGMWSYSAEYLRAVREASAHYQIPLIADEIATGFGRTGRLFACEHADIAPDILCLGKALSGGYLSFAAVLSSDKIADSVISDESGALCHGPTFMANPLACAVSNASVNLLLQGNWQTRVNTIERILKEELEVARTHPAVHDVRCLGATGVIEFKKAPDCRQLQSAVVAQGVWLRPFGNLLYTMPAYTIKARDLRRIARSMCVALSAL